MIIDFAVDGADKVFVAREEGLVAAQWVDDGQAFVGHRSRAAIWFSDDLDPGTVGATVAN